MSSHYAFRISRSYEELKEFVYRASAVCSRIIVYEHEPEVLGCSRTHIHGVIMDCKKKSNTLKNWVEEVLGMRPVKEDWSFLTYYTKKPSKEHIPITEDNWTGCITYQSKGQLQYKYVKDISEELIREAMSKWVEPSKRSVYIKGDLILECNEVKKVYKKTQYEVACEIEMWVLENPNVEKSQIIDRTMYIMKQNKMLCHYRQVANIVQHVLSSWDPNYYKNKILDIV